MPLEAYARGRKWWVRGHVDYNGSPISDYYRCSTGASTEAGARDWIQAEEQRQIRCYLLGEDAALTFNDAVLLYPAKPKEAGYLARILPHLGTTLLRNITGTLVRSLGPIVYPGDSTDTWRRQIIAPVSAVINHAHDAHGVCAPIRIKGFTTQQRIDQDAARGKQSRKPRPAGSWGWIDAVSPHCNPYVAAGLEMMFETGIRISQLVAIAPEHLDLFGKRVLIIAQKGHPEQWIEISQEMMVTLANLPPRRPTHRITGMKGAPRVFGYGNRTGFTSALRSACKKAGVPYLTPHEAGRRGYYTELRVRQGLDPVNVAKAGRWSNHQLPDAIYAAAEADERSVREAVRTNRVQNGASKVDKALKRGGKK